MSLFDESKCSEQSGSVGYTTSIHPVVLVSVALLIGILIGILI